ncbi:hypothetical protein [Candidatus Darwinibacter acetoxidans]
MMRARQLMVGGIIGGHVAAVAVIAVSWLVGGPEHAVSAAFAAVLVLVFNMVGHAVQVMVSDADPKVALVAALVSYVARVTVMGMVLAVVLFNADKFEWLQPVAVVWGVFVVLFGWLATELWVFSRLRIPVYDPPDEVHGK